MNYFLEVLTPRQKKVIQQLGNLMQEMNFYLAGGTAVALHLGHRKSIDLDWFTEETIADPMILAKELRKHNINFETEQIARGTLHGTINNVKVSFIEFRYPLLRKLFFLNTFKCPLASLEDLATMKISVVAQRGSKKDFVDIYAIGTKGLPLDKMLSYYQKKFHVKDIAHVLYGLVYFDDAEKEKMPKMLWRIDWNTVKRTITEWVKKIK